ncbi:hypothetical protein AA958_20255 [Streptomyces sp. CNQ-509]|uniref:DUF3558 family protein n=1 Tax=unclassified Streptomyces TaxID=2593676 RepID=UPI00062DCCAB|nr:DUF3558 family protein [Streptomyces sp. CNQ-509]AKH84129.1 hypothetical protein AA958_20255 [Streptomyces sp. CNQ-509]
MHRSTTRIPRALAAAAVPVILVTAGCSSGDDGGDSGKPSSAAPSSESSEPQIEPAKFAKLPDPCDALAKDSIKDLVPGAKSTAGEAGKSADTSQRSSCSWDGLDGYQWRWLDVSYQRYDSDPAVGSGADRAAEYYAKQARAAEAAEGAKGMKTSAPSGLGQKAAAFTYETTEDKQDYRKQTVVSLRENVVVTVNYHGAGFQGTDQPKAADLLKDAEKATKEALAAVK